MPNETLARRYATAVFGLAVDGGRVAEVQHDLHTFVGALDADTSIRKFFRSPVVDRKEKVEIISTAFSKLDPIALHTLLLLIRKRRENMVEEIVSQYDVLERHGRGARTLSITSAKQLSQSEVDAIVARLNAAFGTSFDVTQSVDPDLIGGVSITMGDRRIDGTVAGRLDDIARLLSTN